MDYFFTSRVTTRRHYQAVPGVALDGATYTSRSRALKDGTPFFLGADMRPLEPQCSFFYELAKTLEAKSLRDYTYDFLDLDDFLARLDPPSDLLSATEDDLIAYRDIASSTATSRWRRLPGSAAGPRSTGSTTGPSMRPGSSTGARTIARRTAATSSTGAGPANSMYAI